jgi:excisionase family DNA binding protein
MNQAVAPQEPSSTLDLVEAAALCKCGVQRLRALARSGAIPATKVGRRWVFSTRLLQEWIDMQALANVRSRFYTRPRGGITVTQALVSGTALPVTQGKTAS